MALINEQVKFIIRAIVSLCLIRRLIYSFVKHLTWHICFGFMSQYLFKLFPVAVKRTTFAGKQADYGEI